MYSQSSAPQLASTLYWCCPLLSHLSTAGHVQGQSVFALQTANSREDLNPHLIHGSLYYPSIHVPNGVSIGSAITGLMVMTCQQTVVNPMPLSQVDNTEHRPITYGNSTHLASAAMRSSNKWSVGS